MAVAVPWMNEDGETISVIYGEAAHQERGNLLWYYVVALGLVLIGGALGRYCMARVYLPVVALTEQARAAANGDMRPAKHQSAETHELASAISMLSESVEIQVNRRREDGDSVEQ